MDLCEKCPFSRFLSFFVETSIKSDFLGNYRQIFIFISETWLFLSRFKKSRFQWKFSKKFPFSRILSIFVGIFEKSRFSLTFLRNIHLVEFWKNHNFCGNFPKISVSLEFWKTITIFVEISILVKLFEKFPLSLKTSKKFDFLGNFRKISLLVEFRKKVLFLSRITKNIALSGNFR